MAKKQKPQGIYANKYQSVPDWVVTKIKVDRFRALAWLTEQTDPEIFLEVLKSPEPDDYGNIHYIVVDEYTTNRKRQQAKTGIENAKKVVNQHSQETQNAQFRSSPETHADGVQQARTTPAPTADFADDIPF